MPSVIATLLLVRWAARRLTAIWSHLAQSDPRNCDQLKVPLSKANELGQSGGGALIYCNSLTIWGLRRRLRRFLLLISIGCDMEGLRHKSRSSGLQEGIYCLFN